MLKNWTVKVKSIKNKHKGINSRSSYLVDTVRQAHHQTTIIPLSNIHRATANIFSEIDSDQLERKRLGKGNKGLSSYGAEFTFNLPQSIPQPTAEQWKMIYKRLVVDLAKELNQERVIERYYDTSGKVRSKTTGFVESKKLSAKELHQVIIPVVHNESGLKPNHLHMLVGKVVKGNRLIELNRKDVLRRMKISFNEAVLDVLEVDNKTYKAERTGVGDKPLWVARNEKIQMDVDKKINDAKIELMAMMKRFSDSLKKFVNFAVKEESCQQEKKYAQEVVEAIEGISPLPYREEAFMQAKDTADTLGSLILNDELDKSDLTGKDDLDKPKGKRKRRRRKKP